MKIVYLGSGEFGIETLNALINSSHNLQLVVTQPPQPAGRGRAFTPTPVARWAKDRSIPFIETEDVNTPDNFERIAALEAELIVVIAFGQKIGSQLINLPPKGAINVHASLLPKYRGAAPINWAIINGERQTGITLITLAEKMDTGLICAQAKTDIGPDETAGELADRLAKMAAPLLLETLTKIADGSIVYTEQDHSKATLAPKLKKSDGYLDFSEPADRLRRRILGLWPWPGASAIYKVAWASCPCKHGRDVRATALRVTIGQADVVETRGPTHLPTGTLDDNLNIVCSEGALKIAKIKPAGSRLMDFKDFVNGWAVRPGDLFLKIDSGYAIP